MATLKQKLALQKITENHGNVSRGMLEAGYSPNTAKKPSNLTQSKGWQELLQEYLPDKDLAKIHKEGLKAIKKEHKIVDRDDDGKPIYDFVDVEDYATRHKYLETAYKLKRKFPSESLEIKDTTNVLTPEEQRARVDRLLDELTEIERRRRTDNKPVESVLSSQ